MAKRPAKSNKRRQVVGRLALLVIAALVLYLVVPQIGGLEGSWAALGGANPSFMVPALLLLGLTFVMAALSYTVLAFRILHFYPTLLVQVAGGLVGKILPAGLGMLGLNALYLTKRKFTSAETTVMLGTNNIIGFICFLALTIFVAAYAGQDVSLPHIELLYALLVAFGIVALAATLIIFWKKRIVEWLRTVAKGFVRYHQQPWRVLLSIVPNLLLPIVYGLLLYISAQALDLHVTLLQALAAFIAGQTVGTVTPTPGGLIGAEAGITAVLVGFGLPVSEALSVALLFRLVTFWLPMVLGAVVFPFVRKRYL